jgi:hypothetical protein
MSLIRFFFCDYPIYHNDLPMLEQWSPRVVQVSWRVMPIHLVVLKVQGLPMWFATGLQLMG